MLCITKFFVMKRNLQEELTHIRIMMERSTRFLSLSGWAGIMAGIYASIGAYYARKLIYNSASIEIYFDIKDGSMSKGLLYLLAIATGVFLLSMATALYTCSRTAKKSGEKLFTPAALKMLYNMAIPFITGGVLSIILILKGLMGLVAPITLIFYGLSLVIASHYTYRNIKVLGILEVALGLLAACYQGYGLFFWTLGFGVLHILYGTLMYLKYKQ